MTDDKDDYNDESSLYVEITQSFANSLVQSSDLIDVASDYSENLVASMVNTLEPNIDNILSSPLFDRIPFFKTVTAVGKAIYNIRNRNILIQTYFFIREFNLNTLYKINVYPGYLNNAN